MPTHGRENPFANPRSIAMKDLSTRLLALFALGLCAFGPHAPTQGTPTGCTPHWVSGEGLFDTNGTVMSMTALPNGDLVVGGDFSIAGRFLCSNIARWNGSYWSPLGSGMDDVVLALETLPNGDVVAGGMFSTAGGVPCIGIARWDGTSWSPLGSGTYGRVAALETLPSGDLIVGGNFTAAGGMPCSRIARWDGSSWSPLGSGMNGGQVSALATLPNGDLVAGGTFTAAGGVPCNRVARWDGTSWSPLGQGLSAGSGCQSPYPWLYAEVRALASLPNGELVAGGYFMSPGSVACDNVARWDGSSWLPLGQGLSALGGLLLGVGGVRALATLPNGDVVACGSFTVAGVNGIARWNGSSWTPLGSSSPLYAGWSLTKLPNGDLVLGGGDIFRWDGTSWHEVGSGWNGWGVWTLTRLRNGDLVAGGTFTRAGAPVCNNVARLDGESWIPMGSGMDRTVYSLKTLPNGNVVAGGEFSTAGGVACSRIARWDGSSWHPLGSGTNGNVQALAVLPNGDLVAGGRFTTAGGVACNGIARWDGSSWFPLGSGVRGEVNSLLGLPNGDVVAGGYFPTAGGVVCNSIARWDGSSWSPLGMGITFGALQTAHVHSLAALPNGDLVVGGQFTAAGWFWCSNIARWDGSSWSPLGSGSITSTYSLATLPNGDLAAGGWFLTADAPGYDNVARWDGTSWSSLGSGVDGSVLAMATVENGELVVGGRFTMAGGRVSARVARLIVPCPATSASYGTGCAGSAGQTTLRSDPLPWTGGTWTLIGGTFAPRALGSCVLGFGRLQTALRSLHAAGGAGCDLLVTPDVVVPVAPVGGEARYSIALPRVASLAGVQLNAQMLALEVNAGGTPTSITSTNALHVVVGVNF